MVLLSISKSTLDPYLISGIVYVVLIKISIFVSIIFLSTLAWAQNSNPSDLFPEHQSELNIPLTFSTYNELESYIHQAENAHTAAKPYIYSEVQPYINLDDIKAPLFKDKRSWFGRKWWNEHMFIVKEDNFWFTINPGADLQVGKDNSDQIESTYNNTRSIQIQGGIGKQFSFSTSFYESQGRFANYINQEISSKVPLGAAGTVLGRGKGKAFKDQGFDYPVAEAYISYTPNKTFNFQFGNGKNFIGDGYRSLLLSDVASPSPFLKLTTTFWKLRYTNTWMWLKDVRPEVTEDGAFLSKYIANHYLSWNVSKRVTSASLSGDHGSLSAHHFSI